MYSIRKSGKKREKEGRRGKEEPGTLRRKKKKDVVRPNGDL